MIRFQCLLNLGIVLAVLKLLAFVLKIEEVLVCHNVARVLPLWDGAQQRGNLRLGKSELVMNEGPEVLGLVICNRLGTKLAPSTLADDSVKLNSVRYTSKLRFSFGPVPWRRHA